MKLSANSTHFLNNLAPNNSFVVTRPYFDHFSDKTDPKLPTRLDLPLRSITPTYIASKASKKTVLVPPYPLTWSGKNIFANGPASSFPFILYHVRTGFPAKQNFIWHILAQLSSIPFPCNISSPRDATAMVN